MIDLNKILKKIIITEKAGVACAGLNKYTFEVYKNSNKTQVAIAISKLFSTKVKKINMLNRPGKLKNNHTNQKKSGCTSSTKRAIVTLKKGYKISYT